MGEHAKGETLSVAFAGPGQHQDAGAKMIHMAPYTQSSIVSKSIARGGGRAGYRGEVRVDAAAHHSANTVRCDALLVDTKSRSDTYPAIDIRVDDVQLGHEATVSKVSEEQLFYLQSRGMPEDEAMAMIVRGFIEPIARELPMEYAMELNKLIEMGMEGSVRLVTAATTAPAEAQHTNAHIDPAAQVSAAGFVPVQTRSERPHSFEPADFGAPHRARGQLEAHTPSRSSPRCSRWLRRTTGVSYTINAGEQYIAAPTRDRHRPPRARSSSLKTSPRPWPGRDPPRPLHVRIPREEEVAEPIFVSIAVSEPTVVPTRTS